MQNDYNPQFNLSIETHEGVKHLHPLNADDVRIFSKFAISGTLRKQIMQNFFHSIENQSPEKFAHIQKWVEGILAGDKTKFFTVQIERIEQQAEIPDYLRCDPRTYKVTYDKWSDVCDLEFTIVIKCTDDELHDHNNFWSNSESRLKENNGDIVSVILKMISKNVFWAVYEGKNIVSSDHSASWGINSIFHAEGWRHNCFEITKLYFDNHVSGDDFEFEPVQAEGASS